MNRVVLAGNSIGAVVALQVASTRPDLVKGLCLLNPAGRFNPETAERWKQRRGSSQTEPFPMQSGSTVGSPTPRCTFRFPFTPWEVLRSDVEYARNWFERAAASTTFFSLRFQIRQVRLRFPSCLACAAYLGGPIVMIFSLFSFFFLPDTQQHLPGQDEG